MLVLFIGSSGSGFVVPQNVEAMSSDIKNNNNNMKSNNDMSTSI